MTARVPQLNNQISAAAIDDVLAFTPVEMHRRDLAVADVHDFFRVAFFVRHAVRRPVAQGEQGQSLSGKAIAAEGGHIPAEFEIEHFAPGVMIELPPLGRREAGKRRKVNVMH
ncbi:hypothetical protein D3C85_1517120 [compost metagenome]